MQSTDRKQRKPQCDDLSTISPSSLTGTKDNQLEAHPTQIKFRELSNPTQNNFNILELEGPIEVIQPNSIICHRERKETREFGLLIQSL